MKVFISWSGTTSHKVAIVLRDWLPSVLQTIKPYVSSEDIDKGARWSSDIAGELDASAYGIVCLTPENVDAPWINFEAGALGKSVDKSRVSPFLFRLKRSDVNGPILQFQSTIVEREDVFKLVRSMNDACQQEALEDARLERAFDVWWPQLEAELNGIPQAEQPAQLAEADRGVDSKTSQVLEELLELTRTNHKILRDPTALLPIEYFHQAINRTRHGMIGPDTPAFMDALKRFAEVEAFCDRIRSTGPVTPDLLELFELVSRMEGPLRYLARDSGLRWPRDLERPRL
jgi:TIR domain